MHLRFDKIIHTYTSPAGEPRTVLDIPNWEIEPGEQVLLRGVSGSGKTTLFNIAAGLMHPTQGHIWYGQEALYALYEARRDRFRAQHVGYIFQNHYLVGALSALQNVVMPMAFARKWPPSVWRNRAADLLARVGLSDHLHYHPDQLSTGQRLRVGIARALANQPDLLLADEPTAALDPDGAVSVMQLIQATCREANATLIVSSHDPALEPNFTYRATLANGNLTLETKTAEVV